VFFKGFFMKKVYAIGFSLIMSSAVWAGDAPEQLGAFSTVRLTNREFVRAKIDQWKESVYAWERQIRAGQKLDLDRYLSLSAAYAKMLEEARKSGCQPEAYEMSKCWELTNAAWEGDYNKQNNQRRRKLIYPNQ
jgi:hypothetical protein